MALMTVHSGQVAAPDLHPGVLMILKEPPAMVCVVDEVTDGGEGFYGTDLETGTRIEYATELFTPFIGKLTLEQ